MGMRWTALVGLVVLAACGGSGESGEMRDPLVNAPGDGMAGGMAGSGAEAPRPPGSAAYTCECMSSEGPFFPLSEWKTDCVDTQGAAVDDAYARICAAEVAARPDHYGKCACLCFADFECPP